jgi:hypothetical protein
MVVDVIHLNSRLQNLIDDTGRNLKDKKYTLHLPKRLNHMASFSLKATVTMHHSS